MRSLVERPDLADERRSIFPDFSDHVDDIVLVANTSYRHPVPLGAQYVVFSLDADFRAKAGNSTVTAALGATATTNGTGSELNPAQRRIPDGATHIALISTANAKGSLAFYA